MKTPLVVIVGRPNVGKSTLFNRLIGKRESIVDDISGVTRDRNYGTADWDNKNFRVIDTGGYIPDSKDLFEAAIREQVELAIDESDAILFMVDVRTGVHPVDMEILKILRNAGKDFFLVANKADNQKYEIYAQEFYNLGVDRIFPVSALSGKNVGDLLEELTKKFPLAGDITEDRRLKIAIVGRPNVGKSSLTNSLLGYDRSIVTDIPGTTRDSVDSVLKYHGKEIVLIDTAGLRKKKKIQEGIEFYSMIRSLKAIGECDVAVVMLDANAGLEKQDLKIIEEAVRWRKAVIIAVNKWDIFEKDENTAHLYEKELKQKLGLLDYIPAIFISAKTKQRIYKLIQLAFELESERKKKIPTNQLNEIMLSEIRDNPPPATPTGKEVKIKYITQAGEHYPVFLFFTNYPKLVPVHYQRFLARKIREHFGFAGIPFTISFKEK